MKISQRAYEFAFVMQPLKLQGAAKNRLPDMYQLKECVVAGGLKSYSANLSDSFRQGAICASPGSQ